MQVPDEQNLETETLLGKNCGFFGDENVIG